MGTAQAVLSKCQNCNEHGTDFCYDCKKVLCDICRTNHDKYTKINKHIVGQLKYVNQEILKTKMNCEKHDRKFEHFCSTCNTLVCSDCVTASHAKHEFRDLSATVQNAEEDLTSLQIKLQEKRQKLSSVLTNIKSVLIPNLKKENEAIRNDIQNTSCTLHAVIDNVKVAAEIRNKECYSVEKDRLNTTTKEAERLCAKYDSAIDDIIKAFSTKHPVGFLIVYGHVQKIVHYLEEIIDTVEDGHIPAFDMIEFTHKVINTMLLNMNESKLQDRDSKIKKLEEKEKKLTKDIGRLQQQMKKTKEEHERTIIKMQQTNDQLLRKLQDRQSTIQTLKNNEETLTAEVKRKLQDRQSTIQTLTQKEETLTKEFNRIQLQMKMDKSAHGKRVIEMLVKIGKLLSQLRDSETKIKTLQDNYTLACIRAQVEMNKLKGEKIKLDKENALLRKKLRTFETPNVDDDEYTPRRRLQRGPYKKERY